MNTSKVIEAFGNRKVLLMGDSILDVYIYSDIVNEALYAPIPEVEERRVAISFGGNGLIASNILALGGKLHFVSITGDDQEAGHYDSLAHSNLEKSFLVDNTRKTTVKKRWFVKNKPLLQANQVDNHDISPALESKILKIIKREIPSVEVVVIMDPQHGMMTKRLIREIIQLGKKNNKPVYVDTQISHRPSNHHLYKGADTIFLNIKEAKAVYPKFSAASLDSALRAIKKKLNLKNVVIKLGEHGSAALWNDKIIKSPARKIKAVDVCGAGDAFLAAFCLGDRNNPEESLSVANAWAGLSTTIHGTIPPEKKDLLRIFL